MSDAKRSLPKSEPAVGYGRPPAQTRFKKGQSGNPKGRERGSRNLKTDLLEELAERISITVGDRLESITKQRALIKSVMAKAVKGDMRAVAIICGLVIPLQDAMVEKNAAPAPTDDDKALMDLLVRYLQEQQKLPQLPPSSPGENDVSTENFEKEA